MDLDRLMGRRYSCRSYTAEPLTEEELAALIRAANAAPVGSARYMDVHLTVVRDREILDRLIESADPEKTFFVWLLG